MPDFTDINEYHSMVRRYAKSRKYFVISNGSPDHASFLISTIFENAKSCVRISTGELYHGVFDDEELIENAKKFLSDSSHSVEIVYDKNDADKSVILGRKFIREISTDPGRKGSVDISAYDPAKTSPPVNHFTVADGAIFRYEMNHEEKKAVANFGDIESAEILDDLFSAIVAKSENIKSLHAAPA